jgi:hypothetical protein
MHALHTFYIYGMGDACTCLSVDFACRSSIAIAIAIAIAFAIAIAIAIAFPRG